MRVRTEDVRCFVSVCSTRNMRPNPEVPHFRPLLWGFFQADFAALVAPALLPWLAQKDPAAFEGSAWMGPPGGRWFYFSDVNGKHKGMNWAQACKVPGRGSKNRRCNKKRAGPTPAARPLWRNHPTAAGPAGQTHPSPSACAPCWLTWCSEAREDRDGQRPGLFTACL